MMERFRNYFLLPFLFLVTLATACRQQKAEPTLFTAMENTGINFSNDIHHTKDFNIFSYRNFYNGGGVAIGDINNDGLSDVFFTANMGSNKLYLNKGNWQFEDISEKAGFTAKQQWSTGVVMVDINHDGWLDIYVCNAGYENGQPPRNQLFINNKNLGFADSAAAYGLTNDGGYCTHAAFFDYDLDGDLDCFIVNNSFIPVNTLNYANKRALRAKDWPVADFLKGGGDKLLRNDNGKFTDVSEAAGIHGSLISFGLGVTVGDVNGDHYPDIYVSNDFFERDYLYINKQNGAFSDEAEHWLQHTSFSSMGADMGDVNNDGYPDIFVTDMLPDDDYRLKTTTSFDNIDVYRLKERSGFYHQFTQNTLQLNNRNGKFQDIAFYGGVAGSDWSWGGLMFDANNDGFNDVFVCNGIYQDVTSQDFIDFFDYANQQMALTGRKEQVDSVISKMPSTPIPNKAFMNNGNLRFTDAGKAWGLSQPSFSNGSAYGDLDNDGDLDLVVNNLNQKAFVYRNNSREQNGNNYIGITLMATSEQNPFAIGSKVFIYQGASIISRELIPTRGFQSSVDYKIVAGLGKGAVDSIVVVWPDASTNTYIKPEINKYHGYIQSSDGRPFYRKPKANPLLAAEQQAFDKHVENEYIDFYQERNIPKMLSTEGPCVAVADVNGDGLEDVYAGGAAGQAGQLYIQNANGFVKKEQQAFSETAAYEDVAAVFFDCDNDKDMDLFVGAGGNHVPRGGQELQHRLYVNDGKGNFTVRTDFPQNLVNTAVAAANDIDNDGDTDLFVGARSVPFQYGITPTSSVFINDGRGKFTAMSEAALGSLATVGMVTGATWVNVVGDAKKELVVVGEWFGPKIFAFENGRATEVKTALSDLTGWWKSVAAADMDGDGDQDLLLGNTGQNFYLRPDSSHSVKMWIKDFDNNGGQDVIITRSINGRDMPVFLKRELTDQMPSLKKQNLRHEEYAKRAIQDLLTPEQLKDAVVKTFSYAASCIAINNGSGRFTVQPLPVEVQLSSVNALLPVDVNGDGKLDIIAGGNEFGFMPQFSRLDASFGNVLLNKGNGAFTVAEAAASGMEVRGQVKHIAQIAGGAKRYVIVVQNNDLPVLYRLK